MADPESQEEFLRRYIAGEKVEGKGVGNVYMTVPCPFCAAPDWLTWELLSVKEVMGTGATCKECGRGCKAIFNEDSGGVAFEIVQTGGNDPPEWMNPKMRRLS